MKENTSTQALIISEQWDAERKKLLSKMFRCIEFMVLHKNDTEDATVNFLKGYANINKLNELMLQLHKIEESPEKLLGTFILPSLKRHELDNGTKGND